ncbi:MAG: 6,7-dimethyl-8-ribityllumazine synthase [Rhodospirillaceae bacterium]|jgi:6,7-dimethyl-8-ribityllumazine synthase|nr:6,7-dimethyl-8-ribityllumazine synthase [Rhodospirillaceae bacterium]
MNKIMIIESRFYDEITDDLLKGAIEELEGVNYKRLVVPGILEIPAAISYIMKYSNERYAGYIVLGCAIKGETDHYEHVSREAINGVQKLALDFTLAVGNGILTVHNRAQAMERCSPLKRNFGGQAARACLKMIEIKHNLIDLHI